MKKRLRLRCQNLSSLAIRPKVLSILRIRHSRLTPTIIIITRSVCKVNVIYLIHLAQNLSSSLQNQPWGVATMYVSSDVVEASVPKRLTMLFLACLRASGTLRVFVEVKPDDVAKQKEFYTSLGFMPLTCTNRESKNESPSYMSRCY